MQLGIRDKVSFTDYLKLEKKEDFLRNVEFFVTGRAPYKLKDIHLFSSDLKTMKMWYPIVSYL